MFSGLTSHVSVITPPLASTSARFVNCMRTKTLRCRNETGKYTFKLLNGCQAAKDSVNSKRSRYLMYFMTYAVTHVLLVLIISAARITLKPELGTLQDWIEAK